MYRLRIILVFVFVTYLFVQISGQIVGKQFLVKPFQNNVFVKENGQFDRYAKAMNVPFTEPVFYAVENAEFNAYFTAKGIVFMFPEWKKNREKKSEKKEKRKEGEREEREIEAVFHTESMQWLNSNPAVEVIATEKVQGYYNYDNISNADTTRCDFVPAFKKLKYINLYPGVDVEFELPDGGGIKYKISVHPNVQPPVISFQWDGLEKMNLDEKGNLHLKSKFQLFNLKYKWHIMDQAPTAYSTVSHRNIPVHYGLEKNKVTFEFSTDTQFLSEGITIDPWITNTAFPDINRAFDIQEDSLGNVFVIGNHTNWQVQKYDPTGVLQWTYVNYDVLMGDIAVDNPGNVYIIGGYSTGKRQKVDPTGVQVWQQSGLAEEWRLAFNYSKTVLAIGGYFVNPGSNNLAKLDMSTGAISNQIVYGEETRGLGTDCNGDIYSLHVTFGYSGAGASNVLRKTNANFTPAGVLVNGFLLAEAQPAGTGYGYNPAYSPTSIYQVLNAIVVNGPSVFIYDGATLKQVDKATMTITNSVAVPNGVVTMCGGVTADVCGNIYVGSTIGIEKFSPSLVHLQTIATPAAVYDLILGKDGDLLACGEGFLGSFDANCTPPPQLVTTLTSTLASCNGGSVSVSATGGTPPYSYLWEPGGQTTATVNHLAVGNYTCTVTDPFCRVVSDTISIHSKTPLALTSSSTKSCVYDSIGSATAIVTGGQTPYSYLWNTLPAQINQTAIGITHGTYKVIITDADTCMDSTLVVVDTFSQPISNFNFSNECFHDSINFLNQSYVASGSLITNWQWDFGDGTIFNTSVWSPSYLYGSPGDYAVALIVSSDKGCRDTVIDTVTVFAPPDANFNTADVCLNDSAIFVDLSNFAGGSITEWRWSFGDSSLINTNQNPSHLYATAGTYVVTLIAKNNLGCYDTISKTIIIHPMPHASFVPANVCFGDLSQFNSLSTVVSPDVISAYTWLFGDGNMINGSAVSHLYGAAGTYTIQLFVTTNFGCADSITKQTVINSVPLVSFSANDTVGCELLCVNFQDASVVANANIVGWLWSFGNSSPTSNSQNPQRCYSNDSVFAPNYYSVTLTATSDSGCVSTVTKLNYITVYPLPHAAFAVSPLTAVITNPVINVTDLSVGANTWIWSWGDTGSAVIQSPMPHLYTDTGSYTITLFTSTQYQCVDSTQQTIVIEPDFTFYIPNAFTPDGDGINDTFTGKGIFIKEFEMMIFDRWGNLIYKTINMDKPWNGTANTGTEEAQVDVYVYVVKVTDFKNLNHSFRGTVTLVR
jgi:gliding motility-associated-like protein